ncbi:AAA family ATPase [Arcicella sp. DC2W]|uniref:AAA family ATPase n=1 Tax=Arcicella gelida TaxID=2984195 RepID=A0ABU5RZQ8_9BACT|nr:AAA family ATPase [Arcicella sp. DC2W]MEA5401660.1 AAA family ATPase [Arcicella sp. DC2W]
MGILLKQIRVHGFRGLDNVEVDFEPTTVLVGTNNAGKTTLLKALQLALSNSFQITDDDFYFSDSIIRDKIVVDLLFISIDEQGNQQSEFEDTWATVFTENRISFDANGNQILAFRTIIEENLIRKTFTKKQFVIDDWGDFRNEVDGCWYQKNYDNALSFYFDEIPFFYLDANRDILEDLKSKTSFLGKILSSIDYEDGDKELIENLIKDLNKETIERSEILTNLHSTLEELDTAMDNPNNTVDITPFTKKLRDLNKGVKINYSQFSMEYHGMGTRSWSSLLILKAFILQNMKLANQSQVAYYPIIAIEEPESHLHPNAQKKLYSQINNIIGQKIVATHSSYIAGSAKLKEIRSLIKSNGDSIIGKIEESELHLEDIRKINRQVINTRGELYFSKVVILCEGETEEQALPLLLKKHFNKSTIELGIDVVGIDGGGNYFPFIYFAEKLNIAWFILSDGESSIIKKIKKDYKKLTNSSANINNIILPENIVHFDNDDDFESYILRNGFLEEIETCLKTILGIEDIDEFIANKNGTSKGRVKTSDICENCNQNIFIEDLRDYSGEVGRIIALNDLLSQNKTKYSGILSELIYHSNKPLPLKITELFEKVSSIINPTSSNVEN